MFDIESMAEDLKDENAFRETRYPITTSGYTKCVVQAIKKFFVDVNHPSEYDRTLFTTTEENVLVYDYDFDIVQEEYIFILAKMRYAKMIYRENSGDGAISYTTDALSVTGAKEGYKSIQQELDELERERIRVFHKMMARDANET